MWCLGKYFGCILCLSLGLCLIRCPVSVFPRRVPASCPQYHLSQQASVYSYSHVLRDTWGSWGATHVREASTITVPNDAMRLFVPVALWSSQSGEMPRRYSSQDLALSLKNTWLCLFTVEWQLPKTEAALFGLGLALFVVFIQCFHNQPQSFPQLWSIASHRTLPWSSSEGRRYERILSRRRNLHPNGRHTYSSLEANRSWGLEKWLSS